MLPTAFDRGEMLRRLADQPYDLLVVGGGITGVGVALDAASAACARRSSTPAISPPARPPRARS